MQDAGSRVGHVAVTDFDVHGLVRIRLRHAPPHVLEAVSRELGQPGSAPAEEPDITVTFTDDLGSSGDLRMLGLHQAAYDDEHFYLLDAAGNRTRIDLSQLGDRCELVCERSVRDVPLLIPMLALCLLGKDHVLLHAASFVYGNRGVLVTGWQKGGKTETLLPFMAAGAEFVADEWTVVGGEEPGMFGIANIARIWDWQLRQLPQFWPKLRPRARMRLRMWRLYRRLCQVLPMWRRLPGRAVQRLRRWSMDGGSAWQGVDGVPPSALFGERVRHGRVALDRVFLPVLGRDPRVDVIPVKAEEVARRMVSSLAFERRALATAYLQFRFAFPDRASRLMETARQREEQLLLRAFAGLPTFEIRHPYPVRLRDLYEAAARYC